MLDRLKQIIIYSNFRDFLLYCRFLLKKISTKKYLWKFKFEKIHSNNRILLFFPSLTIDKPSFLNVGIRLFIESAKESSIQCDLLLCNAGLDICHLGGSPFNSQNKMPCKTCYKVNNSMYMDLNKIEFTNIQINHTKRLSKMSFEELKIYEYKTYKIGELVCPSIVWILRDANLSPEHKSYFVRFLNSAMNFIDFLDNLNLNKYSSVLVFNGVIYPENILFEYCKKNDINVATFESGFNFEDNPAIEFNYGYTSNHDFKFKEKKMDPIEIRALAKKFSTDNKKNLNSNTVVIYGNVSWDTSQFKSHTIFESMYEWLNFITPILKEYPNYNFIYKAHPGENRKIKKTWFGLSEWYELNNLQDQSNFKLIKSTDSVNTHNLINNSCLSLVYNSTVGLESVILGVKAIPAAKTHYTNKSFVSSFSNKQEYEDHLRFLLESRNFEIDKSQVNEAKNYYYQLYSDVSYNLGKVSTKISPNEFTLNSKINSKSAIKESLLNNLPKSFNNKKSLERFFNT